MKSECQLTGLAKGVEFITQKIWWVWQRWTWKGCNNWEEHYPRRNCILIHGLKEEKNESTDDRVLKLSRQELNKDALIADLDQTHRIEKKRKWVPNECFNWS